jgi:hypothetical protein
MVGAFGDVTSAGSFVGQCTVEAMNASTEPLEAASKQVSGGSPCSAACRCGPRDDDFDVQAAELGREIRETRDVPVAPRQARPAPALSDFMCISLAGGHGKVGRRSGEFKTCS